MRRVCLVMISGGVGKKKVVIQTKVHTSMWLIYVHSNGDGRVFNNQDEYTQCPILDMVSTRKLNRVVFGRELVLRRITRTKNTMRP